MSGSPASAPDLRSLAAHAEAVDGAPPFSDQALIDAASGAAQVLGFATAAAILTDASDGSPAQAELAVDPLLRGRGLGGELLDGVLARAGRPLLVWAHGDLPAARALAASRGFHEVRRLLQLRATVPDAVPAPAPRPDVRIRPFAVGADEEAWLELNARAFASHPEQGRLGIDDLRAREQDEWFDPDAFLLAEDPATAELIGFCWLKIERGFGEFYVVGVAPERQGQRLGGLLVDAGLAALSRRGIRTSSLYVEGDNAAALALYRSRGFAEHSVDVQWQLDGHLLV